MRALILCILCLTAPLLHSEVTTPPLISASELPKHIYQQISIRGQVRDAFADERDQNYAFLIISTDTGPVYVAIKTTTYREYRNYTSYVGAEVIVTGRCNPSYEVPIGQPRRYLGCFLAVQPNQADGLHIITPPPADPFAVPTIEENIENNPYRLQQLGRRRIRGHVLAVWKKNMLVQTRLGYLSRIELSENTTPPIGTFVEAVGFVDTDLYRINLTRAAWQKTASWSVTNTPPRITTAAKILTDGNGNTLVDTTLYGKTIELTGTIQSLPGDVQDGIIRIDNDGYPVPIDISSCPEIVRKLSVGTLIRATGVCVFDIGNCRPNDTFPQVKGFTLIVNLPENVSILRRPPWWTINRLSLALGIVLGLSVIILIWNRALSILVERRGRQLAREQIRRATSDLKILERTRLSVDLHDALSQTLSGIAMQLGAIKRFSTSDPQRMSKHLDIASRTLKSCRDEMRNLLSDLRSQVLDEPDLEKAIRQILEPHLEEAEIRIRFAVPRAQLSDTTTRTLFCIVRELVVNAIRHGHAHTICIAGSLANGRLLCSIRDDGCGFDPASAPSVDEGHFGLQGIRERIENVDGNITIDSTTGKGTKVSVSLSAPRNHD